MRLAQATAAVGNDADHRAEEWQPVSGAGLAWRSDDHITTVANVLMGVVDYE